MTGHVAAERGEAAVEVGEAVVRGDDDGHVAGRAARRDGVGEPGIGQATREHGRRAVTPTRPSRSSSQARRPASVRRSTRGG